jgi:hypothetical protein
MRFVAPLALALVLAGCDSATPTATPASAPAGCASLSPKGSIPEAQGTDLWALLFHELKIKTEIKIVLRVPGTGLITVKAHGPNGEPADPVWLTPHLSSTWDRPGDEIGTGWVFPVAGCWTIETTRPSGKGSVGLLVT